MRWCQVGVPSLLALCLAVPAARAGSITTYSDRSTFTTAMNTTLTVEDFTNSNHYPITTGSLNSATNLTVAHGGAITPGMIQPGVTYSTPVGSGNFFNITQALGFAGAALEGQSKALTVTFDSPAKGFGFDTDRLMGTSFTATIHFTSGGSDYSQTFNVTQGGDDQFPLSFFGFTSDQADIASVDILGTGGYPRSFILDDFTFATPGTVPEPSSVVLAGLGAASGLLAARRRKPAR